MNMVTRLFLELWTVSLSICAAAKTNLWIFFTFSSSSCLSALAVKVNTESKSSTSRHAAYKTTFLAFQRVLFAIVCNVLWPPTQTRMNIDVCFKVGPNSKSSQYHADNWKETRVYRTDSKGMQLFFSQCIQSAFSVIYYNALYVCVIYQSNVLSLLFLLSQLNESH